MKRLTIVLLATLLLTCSFTSTKVENNGNIPQTEQIKTITYRGHTYIVYQFAKSTSGGGGSTYKG